jgi:hypothetical protein
MGEIWKCSREHGTIESMNAFVRYDGGRNGKKESSSPSVGGDAQQEANARTAERDREESRKGPMGFVYFIETEDAQSIKIGFSTSVIRRMSQLGTLMPFRLIGYFPGTRETERWLHTKFAADWQTGEWFRASDELRQFIAMMGLIVPEIKIQPRQRRKIRVPKVRVTLIAPEPEPEPEPKPQCEPEPEGQKEKNPAAVALAKRRAQLLSPERQSEIGRAAGLAGGVARAKKLTANRRTEIAKKAAEKRWGRITGESG